MINIWPQLICLSVIILSACAPKPEAPSRSIQIIIDNGGSVLQNPAEAKELHKEFLKQLADLRNKRDFKNSMLNIVGTRYPKNLWVGRPEKLYREAEKVLLAIQPDPNGCSDIAGAFKEVRQNLRSQEAERSSLYVFSSMIHTGWHCGGVIEVPQDPATLRDFKDLDLQFLKENGVSPILLLWAFTSQRQPWFDYLATNGLKADVADEEETREILEKGLPLN